MKYQVLFSLKKNENVFMNVVCCSHDCSRRNIKFLGLVFYGLVFLVDLIKTILDCLTVSMRMLAII